MEVMTVPAYEGPDDVPSLREICRTLADFREEFRTQMGQVVRKDVHAVEHDHLISRVSRLETSKDNEDKTKATMRNQYLFAVVSAGLSLAVTLIVAVVK